MEASDYTALAAAHAAANGLNPQATAFYELGLLSTALENAQHDLAQYTGKGAKPQNGCHFHTATLGDAEVVLEYEFEPGESAVWNLNSPMCGPGYGPSVAVIQMLVNGAWIDPEGVIEQSVIEGWETRILEQHGADLQDAYEDDRIEAWLERSMEDAA
jgi:hypothetical protein